EVVESSGEALLRPHTGPLKPGTPYFGGSALELERHLGLSGDEILYVGDHMFGDVHVTKNVLRWRTALILRELEEEVRASRAFREDELRLAQLMRVKEGLEFQLCQIRLELQRKKGHYGPPLKSSEKELEAQMEKLRVE